MPEKKNQIWYHGKDYRFKFTVTMLAGRTDSLLHRKLRRHHLTWPLLWSLKITWSFFFFFLKHSYSLVNLGFPTMRSHTLTIMREKLPKVHQHCISHTHHLVLIVSKATYTLTYSTCNLRSNGITHCFFCCLTELEFRRTLTIKYCWLRTTFLGNSVVWNKRWRQILGPWVAPRLKIKVVYLKH